MNYKLIVCFALLVLTSQCSKRESELAPVIKNLIGTWQLATPDSSYKITLRFTYDTANPPIDITPFKANGQSAVNDYTLRLFATEDGMMSADAFSSSKIAGSTEATQVEQSYFTNLNAVVRYQLPNENELRLYYGTSQPGVLVYKRIN